MYVVMISKSGPYQAHSVHQKLEDALAFERCKQHDGEDTAILELDSDAVDEIVRLTEANA